MSGFCVNKKKKTQKTLKIRNGSCENGENLHVAQMMDRQIALSFVIL